MHQFLSSTNPQNPMRLPMPSHGTDVFNACACICIERCLLVRSDLKQSLTLGGEQIAGNAPERSWFGNRARYHGIKQGCRAKTRGIGRDCAHVVDFQFDRGLMNEPDATFTAVDQREFDCFTYD